MGWLTQTFSSSVGKKLLMALTGLFFLLFLLVHLGGNFLLYVGKDAFNAYASALAHMPATIPAEILMIVLFVTHMATSAKLTIENNNARTEKYIVDANAGSSTWMSSHMFHTGSIILVFVIIHLWTFKFGEWSNEMHAATSVTLYDLVVGWFGNVYYSAFYIIAMILLGMHLNHAFQSAFQTLGLNHKKYTPAIKLIGKWYSVVVALGFASFPAIFFLISLGG